MPSIAAAASRISCNYFKRQYLKKQKFFYQFFIDFWNVHQIYSIAQKKRWVC